MRYSLLILFAVSLGCNQSFTNGPLALTPVADPGSPPASESTEQPSKSPPTKESRAVKNAAEPIANQQTPFAKVELTEEDWKQRLGAEEYRILREKGTERAFTGEYDHHFEKGAYVCAACGLVLFESDAKFNSGCGWPAFYASKAGDRVTLTPDLAHGMIRTEVTCARCDGHLGHIFDDAPQTPTGQRYCINSVSIKFVPRAELPKDEAVIEKLDKSDN